MKIAVIAANGRSGKAFVREALRAGHDVVAGVRGDSDLASHKHLKIRRCDATDPDEVRALLKGCDAVVSLIGHVKDSPRSVQTDATKVVVDAMHDAGISRIVSLTGTGVRFPGDRISIVDRLLNASIKAIDPARIQDGINHVKVLKASNLEWTIIRVLKLQDVDTKPYRLTIHGPTKWYVGRKEVARAILEVLEHRSFVHRAPIISAEQ